MDITAILGIVNELAGLAMQLKQAHDAKNQSDFDTAWVAMQTKLASSNLAWVMAGTPPKIG